MSILLMLLDQPGPILHTWPNSAPGGPVPGNSSAHGLEGWDGPESWSALSWESQHLWEGDGVVLQWAERPCTGRDGRSGLSVGWQPSAQHCRWVLICASLQLKPSWGMHICVCVCGWGGVSLPIHFWDPLLWRKDTTQGGDRESTGAAVLWRAQVECKSCTEVMGGNLSNRSWQSAPVGAREISESTRSVNLRGSQLTVCSVFVLHGKHLHRLQMNHCFCAHYCTEVWRPQSYCGRAGLQPRQTRACGCCIHDNSSFHFQSFDTN